MFRAVLAALLPLGIWVHAHPRLALLALAAVLLLAAGVIKACRDFGGPLAVRSWSRPAPWRACPSCGQA